MPRHHVWAAGSLSALLSLGIPLHAAAIDRPWRAATSFSVSSGDYGTNSKTSATSMPFILDRLFDWGRLGVSVPFVSITSEEAVTFVGGTPRKRGKVPSSRKTSGETTESGLGDIVLRGQWDALEETAKRPSLSMLARIKCPTASKSRGLGTGEFDETLSLETSKDLAHDWFVSGDLGYTFVGSPDDDPLRDSWNFGVGGGRNLPHHLSLSSSLDWSRSLRAGDSDPLEWGFALDYTGIDHASLGTTLAFGLTDGAADVTFGLSGAYRF